MLPPEIIIEVIRHLSANTFVDGPFFQNETDGAVVPEPSVSDMYYLVHNPIGKLNTLVDLEEYITSDMFAILMLTLPLDILNAFIDVTERTLTDREKYKLMMMTPSDERFDIDNVPVGEEQMFYAKNFVNTRYLTERENSVAANRTAMLLLNRDPADFDLGVYDDDFEEYFLLAFLQTKRMVDLVNRIGDAHINIDMYKIALLRAPPEHVEQIYHMITEPLYDNEFENIVAARSRLTEPEIEQATVDGMMRDDFTEAEKTRILYQCAPLSVMKIINRMENPTREQQQIAIIRSETDEWFANSEADKDFSLVQYYVLRLEYMSPMSKQFHKTAKSIDLLHYKCKEMYLLQGCDDRYVYAGISVRHFEGYFLQQYHIQMTILKMFAELVPMTRMLQWVDRFSDEYKTEMIIRCKERAEFCAVFNKLNATAFTSREAFNKAALYKCDGNFEGMQSFKNMSGESLAVYIAMKRKSMSQADYNAYETAVLIPFLESGDLSH